MKFREKKDICVDLFFVFLTNFKGIQGFYTRFQAISRVQGAKINSRLFKEPRETMFISGRSTSLVLYRNIDQNVDTCTSHLLKFGNAAWKENSTCIKTRHFANNENHLFNFKYTCIVMLWG